MSGQIFCSRECQVASAQRIGSVLMWLASTSRANDERYDVNLFKKEFNQLEPKDAAALLDTALTPSERVEKKQALLKQWLREMCEQNKYRMVTIYFFSVANAYSAVETFLYPIFHHVYETGYFIYTQCLAVFYNNYAVLDKIMTATDGELERLLNENFGFKIAILQGKTELVIQMYKRVHQWTHQYIRRDDARKRASRLPFLEKEIFAAAYAYGNFGVLKYAMKHFANLRPVFTEMSVAKDFYFFNELVREDDDKLYTVFGTLAFKFVCLKHSDPLKIFDQLNVQSIAALDSNETKLHMLTYMLEDSRFCVSDAVLAAADASVAVRGRWNPVLVANLLRKAHDKQQSCSIMAKIH